MKQVLVADDDSKILRSLGKGLQAAGPHVLVADTGKEGSRLATAHSFDYIAPDRMLPGRDGLQVLSDQQMNRRGFTLIELLVVIVIMAVLIGLLLQRSRRWHQPNVPVP